MTAITTHYLKTGDKPKPVKHSDYSHTISGLLHKRVEMFHEAVGRGELTKQVLTILRREARPMTSREITQEMVYNSGFDARDRKFVSELVKRVGKACRQYPEGTITKANDKNGNVVWRIDSPSEPMIDA